MTLQDEAVETIHGLGAVALDELREELRSQGYRPRNASLDAVHLDYYDVARRGDLFISTWNENPLAIAYAALVELDVGETRDLVGGIRRAFRGGGRVKSVGVRSAAEQIVKEYRTLESKSIDTPGLLADDLRALGIIRAQPGAVSRTKELQALVTADPEITDKRFNVAYSPLLEMVASGVTGVRGADIDLRAVEALRPLGRSPWARWGRLDRERMWVQVTSRGQALRARIPNDCLDVIDDQRKPLTSLTGSPLGSLIVDHHDIHVDWTHPQPADWESQDHPAVIEFNLGEDYAYLSSGASTTEDPDARFVDGCALHNGRWSAVVEIHDHLVEAGTCSIPKAVDGLDGLGVGESRVFDSVDGKVVVTSEPHAFRAVLPPGLLRSPGGHLRLDFDRGACRLLIRAPACGPQEHLLSYVGCEASAKNPWRSMGAALGLQSADHIDVSRRFADRGRFDLAELARTAPMTARTTEATELPADAFRVEHGQLIQDQRGRVLYARRFPGEGALGLQWEESQAPDADGTWASMVLVILRACAAGVDLPVVLRRTPRGWEIPEAPQRSLLAALELVGKSAGSNSIPASTAPLVPMSSFGISHAISAGDRLLELEIASDRWRSTGQEGDSVEGLPMHVLLGGNG